MARDVAADFFGGARGDILVAADDRFAGAALERPDREAAVAKQRKDGGEGEDQRKSRRNVTDARGHASVLGGKHMFRHGLPLTQRAEDVAAGFDRDVEPRAYRPRPFTPGDEDGGRVFVDSSLKSGNARAVLIVVG